MIPGKQEDRVSYAHFPAGAGTASAERGRRTLTVVMSRMLYATGTIRSVNTVGVMSPPITAIAMGARNVPPAQAQCYREHSEEQ